MLHQLHHATRVSRLMSMAQPSTAVRGRAGRCLEAVGAELWRSSQCSVAVSIDYSGKNRHGYRCATWQDCTAAGSWAGHLGSWAKVYSQLGRGTGPAILDPGRGCTVSWAGEQGRPSAGQGNRAGLGNGLGNRAGLGNGLGNRLGRTSWAGEQATAPLVRRAAATATAQLCCGGSAALAGH